MRKKKTVKVNKRFFVVCLACAVFAGYMGYLLVSQQLAISAYKKQQADLDKQLAEELAQKTENEQQLQIVNTEEYIEAYARDELGYVSPDELVFVPVR